MFDGGGGNGIEGGGPGGGNDILAAGAEVPRSTTATRGPSLAAETLT